MTSQTLIIGGGISGLSYAWFLKQHHPTMKLTVLERENHPGGLARSACEQGCVVDRGPSSFLAKEYGVMRLVNALNLSHELVSASPSARNRYLAWRHGLETVPTSPWAMVKTPLLSLKDKLRLLLEPLIPASKQDDETVHAFASRRLGEGFAQVFMTAMLRGITAGDSRRTSVHALFPRMVEVEHRFQSLFLGLLAQQVRNRVRSRTSPHGMFSFARGGMGRLTEALWDRLGDTVETGVVVQRIETSPKPGSWRVVLDSGRVLEAERVAIATPVHVASKLLRCVAPESSELLEVIQHVGIRVLAMAFDSQDVPASLDGFGFLCGPHSEERILGCLWSSSIFPSQAPAGQVLLRVMGGGIHDPRFLNLSEEDAQREALAMLERRLGIEVQPRHVWDWSYPQVMPQYGLGHRARIQLVERMLPRGLILLGNAYTGPGVNDCIERSRRAAHRECE